MKIISLSVFLILSTFAAAAEWQPESVKVINEKWLAGEKQIVRSYAEERLSRNSKDIVALLITWDYAVSFLDVRALKRIAPVLKQVATTTNGAEFVTNKPLLMADVDSVLELVDTITPAMAQAESHKGSIGGKPMNTLLHLRALERDGFFTESKQPLKTPASESPTHKLSERAHEPALPAASTDSSFMPQPVKASVTASIPTPNPESEPAAKTNPVWWIVGLIILAAGVVFVARKKKPKA